MKNINWNVVFMKILFPFVFCLSFITLLNAQEIEEAAPFNFDTHGKWRVEGVLLVGAGLEDHLVGKTSDNKDVNISGGGGVGGSINAGYGLTCAFDLSVGLGIQNSSLQPQVENAEANFQRTIIFATIKYRIPVAEKGQIKLGAGPGYYIPGDFDLDMSSVPDGKHGIFKYESSIGFHFIAEYEGFFSEKYSWTAGLKYNSASYHLKSVTVDGVSSPLDVLQSEVKDEMGKLDGGGVNLTLSVNMYF